MAPPARHVGAAAVVAFVALLLAVETHVGWLAGLDREVAGGLHRWALRHNRAVDGLVVLAVVLSPTVFRLLVVAAAVARWRAGDRAAAVRALLTTAVGAVLGVVLKLLVHQPRPSFANPVATASGYGFPSGHALGSFLGAGLLLLLLRPRRASPWVYAAAAVAVLLTGFDRLALGVHSVSDVIGGWLVVAALLAASGLSAASTDDKAQPAVASRG